MTTLEYITALIEHWLKSNKLNKHFEIVRNPLASHINIFSCKLGHMWYDSRVRLDAEGVYVWKLRGLDMVRERLLLSNPQFFEKLEILLSKQCQYEIHKQIKPKKSKSYHQI